jgi:acetyl-CoA carboxylase carboxyltransferase component
VRRFLSYLPSNSDCPVPAAEARPPRTDPARLADIVPDKLNQAYDVRKVIDAVVDADSFFELRGGYGRSLVTGLARIEGRAVGVLANQSMYQAGVFDARSLDKALKLVDLCDDFGLPLVFLQDLPGVLIGSAAERSGVAVRLMELYKRLAVVKVAKICVVLRKAFGFGWIVMGGAPMGMDYICAWPIAQIGFMAAGNGVEVLHHKRLAEKRARDGDEAARAMAQELQDQLERDNAPWTAVGRAYIHDVIRPEETRQAVLNGLFLGSGYR